MSQQSILFPYMQVTPAQIAAALKLAVVLISQGIYPRAENWLLRLAFLDTRNPYVYALLGSVNQLQGKPEKAIKIYSKAIDLFPDDISSLTNRGELYLQTGKLNEAAADLVRAIELDAACNHPSGARARLLVSMTLNALEGVEKDGIQALES
jgi:tetratricopeptide (TPR) repeat protein